MKVKRPVSAKTFNSLQRLFRTKQFLDEIENQRDEILEYFINKRVIGEFESPSYIKDIFERGSFARIIALFEIKTKIKEQKNDYYRWYAQQVQSLMRKTGFVGVNEFFIFSKFLLEDEIFIPDKFGEIKIEEPDDSQESELRTKVAREYFPLAIRFPPHTTPEELKKFITINANKINELREKYNKRVVVKKKKNNVPFEILDYIIENPKNLNNTQLVFDIRDKFSFEISKKNIEYLKSSEKRKRNQKIF